jgi:ABC-2 type transport system permease protein
MNLALTWTEIKLLTREPLTLVVSLLFPTVLMLLLLASFGSEPDEVFAGLGGTEFYVPSYLGAAIAVMGLIGVPTHLASYRQDGVLRRFRAAGVPATSIVISQTVMMTVLAVIGAGLMLALAYTGFDVSAPASLGGTLLGFSAGLLVFAGIGLYLGSLMPSARAAQGLGLLIFFSTFFLVGGGPPPSLLPDSLNTAVEFTPIAQLADAIRSPWTGAGNDVTALVALTVLAIVTFTLARRRLNRLDLA